MAHFSRRDEILQIISRLRSVTVQELTERLGVSEVTIRKDLTILEEMGAVVRVHGGAKLAEDRTQMRTLEHRRREHMAGKIAIAEVASGLVAEGDTIYLDSGSTCACLAQRLESMNIRVVTNSIDVLTILADAPGISLVSIGGSYRKEAGSFLGPIAVENVKGLHLETCFIGATGISDEGVFSSQNIFESQLKRQVLEVSRRKVVLADSSKLHRSAFSVFARSNDIDILIVDSLPGAAATLETYGIEVIVAGAITED